MKFYVLMVVALNSLLVSGQDIPSRDEGTPVAEILWQGESFHLVFVDLISEKIDLLWKDSEGANISSLGDAENYVEKTLKKKFIFATNAGMFKPDYSPVGLHIENGKTLAPLDKKLKAPGNFYMKPNGVFFIDQSGKAGVLETARFRKTFPSDVQGGKLALATQSGPMLVIDGQVHPAFNKGSVSKYVRSGVGVIGPQTVVFAISKKPVNFHTFASLFRDLLKCQHALYLDGAVSKFHAPGSGLENPGGGFGGIIVVTQ